MVLSSTPRSLLPRPFMSSLKLTVPDASTAVVNPGVENLVNTGLGVHEYLDLIGQSRPVDVTDGIAH